MDPARSLSGAARRAAKLLRRLWPGLLSEWRDDRVPSLAAEVAFWSMLALFPSMVALGSVLSLIEPIAGSQVAESVRQVVTDGFVAVLGPDSEATVQETRALFEQRRGGIFTLTTLLAFWGASRAFAALIRALDVAYDLEESRGWLRQRILGIALACGSLVVIAITLAVVVAGPLMGTGRDLAARFGFGSLFATVWDWLRIPFALAVAVAWNATIFHVAPNHHTPWRADLPGAVVATLGGLLASAGFRVYLEFASAGSSVLLGVLGGALTLMLWLYVLALSVILGGEVNALYWSSTKATGPAVAGTEPPGA